MIGSEVFDDDRRGDGWYDDTVVGATKRQGHTNRPKDFLAKSIGLARAFRLLTPGMILCGLEIEHLQKTRLRLPKRRR
jgi:hypothetical protein